jgi:excisionase family DNA binding protein
MPDIADNANHPEVAEALRNGSARVAHRWLTKLEAMAMLGVSERTIETWIGEQRLGSRPEPRPGKRPLTMVDGDDVERIRAERNKGAIIRTPPASTEIDPVPPAPGDQVLALALRMIGPALERERPKEWLTVEEAAEYSGLPEAFLLRAARRGRVIALDVGKGRRDWRILREDLSRIRADRAAASAECGKAAE